MTEITNAIEKIKQEVSEQEWQQRIVNCRNSKMNTKAWCLENGIKQSTYYCHLRKAREAVLESNQIVEINPSSEHFQNREPY